MFRMIRLTCFYTSLVLRFSYDFNNVLYLCNDTNIYKYFTILVEHVRNRLCSSSVVVAPWRWLQFVADVIWKSIKTKTAIGWKQAGYESWNKKITSLCLKRNWNYVFFLESVTKSSLYSRSFIYDNEFDWNKPENNFFECVM